MVLATADYLEVKYILLAPVTTRKITLLSWVKKIEILSFMWGCIKIQRMYQIKEGVDITRAWSLFLDWQFHAAIYYQSWLQLLFQLIEMLLLTSKKHCAMK